MPLDLTNPSLIFVRALQGQSPTPDQLETIEDPRWLDLIQAAQDATPTLRRATLIRAKSGLTDIEQLLAYLRGEPLPTTAADHQPWPEPTPFGQPYLLRFPTQALPGWFRIYARSEAAATQTPEDLVGMLTLAVLSTALAGPVVLNPWGDWIEPLNLYILVALPPGHRKSAVFTSVVEPLHQFEAEAARAAAPMIALARRRHHAAEQALTRAQDAAALCPDDDPRRPDLIETVERRLHELATQDAPVVPRLIADDCSPERLAMLLHEQGGKLAILSPEGGFFDLIAGRYSTIGAPNLDHVLKGHAGDPIVVDRVGRPGEIIPHPALTIGLTVQPEVLRGLIARPGFHGRGLLARFLYAVPNTTLGHRAGDPEPTHPSIRTPYHRHVHNLLALTHPSPHQPPHPAPSARSTPPAHPVPPAHTSPPPPGEHPLHEPLLPLSRAREMMSAKPIFAPRSGAGGEGFVLPLSHARPTETAGGSSPAPLPQHPKPRTQNPAIVIPFSDPAAERLKQFARAIEPRLAPDADLAPIVDWASKLVGHTARIAGLIHLATLIDPFIPQPHLPLSAPERGLGGEVSPDAVEAAIAIAEYLVAHAQAAYATMGLDPAAANIPTLLAWVKRTGRPTFTRRDALRATPPRLRSAPDLDEALDRLAAHGYIRPRPHRHHPGQGRPTGPVYDVHPSLVAR